MISHRGNDSGMNVIVLLAVAIEYLQPRLQIASLEINRLISYIFNKSS
jgi:hypothetical protein